MVRCPVCDSARVVVVLSPTRSAFCVRCETRWIQDGSHQRSIRRATRGTAADRPSLSLVRPAPTTDRSAAQVAPAAPEPTAS